MSARDFINETLLPKLERELTDEARGNKHYLAGFEDALKAITRRKGSNQIGVKISFKDDESANLLRVDNILAMRSTQCHARIHVASLSH